MRKILTQDEKKSKERFKQIIVGTVLIFIMLLSTLGYSLLSKDDNSSSQGKKVVYNGLEFIKTNDFWVANINNVQFIFKYNPNEIERVDSTLNGVDSYYNQPLYIYSDNAEAISEIYNNLNNIAQRIQKACVEDERCEGDFPVKDCNNNFIIIKENNLTRINQTRGCVFIEGSSENIMNLTDEFLFKILKIVE